MSEEDEVPNWLTALNPDYTGQADRTRTAFSHFKYKICALHAFDKEGPKDIIYATSIHGALINW
jgi:hypothetical protein